MTVAVCALPSEALHGDPSQRLCPKQLSSVRVEGGTQLCPRLQLPQLLGSAACKGAQCSRSPPLAEPPAPSMGPRGRRQCVCTRRTMHLGPGCAPNSPGFLHSFPLSPRGLCVLSGCWAPREGWGLQPAGGLQSGLHPLGQRLLAALGWLGESTPGPEGHLNLLPESAQSAPEGYCHAAWTPDPGGGGQCP